MPDDSVTIEPPVDRPPGEQQALLGQCARCFRAVEPGQLVDTNAGSRHVCATCAEQLRTCSRCRLPIVGEARYSDRGNLICDRHYGWPSYLYEVCDRCDQVTQYPGLTESGRYVCRTCRSLYVYCDGCDVLVLPGDGLCDACAEEQDYDLSDWCYDYSYKPEPVFRGDGPVYLGLELEVDICGSRRAAAEVAADHLGTLGYLKEDSSIDGFEVVTHPMSYRWAMDNFPWRLLADLDRAGAEVHDNTGIHIHVNRDGFQDPCHAFRWLKFIYRNEPQVTAIARRSSAEWAEFHPSGRERAKDAAKGDQDGPRHVAVNTTNFATFELRVFASSLDEQEVQAALAFAAASIEYTRYLKVPDVIHGGWTWAAFTEWLAERDEYAPLRAEMEALACAC